MKYIKGIMISRVNGMASFQIVFFIVHRCDKKCEVLLVLSVLSEIFRNFELILGCTLITKNLQTEYSHRLKNIILWEDTNITIQKVMYV